MVGGAIHRVVMQSEFTRAPGPQPLWPHKRRFRTAKVSCALTTPSSLSRAPSNRPSHDIPKLQVGIGIGQEPLYELLRGVAEGFREGGSGGVYRGGESALEAVSLPEK